MWRIIRRILIVILAAICIWCLYRTVRDLMDYKEIGEVYDAIQHEYIGEPTWTSPVVIDGEKEDVPKEAALYPELDIDYDGLQALNPDFVGVLYVPSLDIMYPIALSHDDNEYLHTSFEGKYLFAGSIFMEMNSKVDLTGWNTWIYGHNMNNGSMFGSLKKYLKNPELCSDNPYFYIYTKSFVRKYRIFAYNTTNMGGAIYRYITDEDSYDEWVKEACEASKYDGFKEVDFTSRPKIVTLSTCYARGHKYTFVVHGALQAIYRQK